MTRLPMVAGACVLAMACAACGAVEGQPGVAIESFELPSADVTTAETVVLSSLPPEGMVRDVGEQPELEEDIGEAASEQSWQGVACRAACWTLAGAGCAAVGTLCAGGTVVTVGGVAIPCWVATATACGVAGGGASVCNDWCTHQFGP